MVSVNNELEALKKRCADQEIYLEQQSQTINALSKKKLGQHEASVLFAAIQHTQMPMILTDPHQPDNPIIFCKQGICRVFRLHRRRVDREKLPFFAR